MLNRFTRMKHTVPAILALGVVFFLGTICTQTTQNQNTQNETTSKIYSPVIDPADFSTTINNPFFTVTPGETFTYTSETKEGTERIEIEITSDTKQVMGVTTLVYWDRVYLNDVLIEDTRDYLAQDTEGNVWYFGEDVDNYEDGKLQDHEGAWLAGVDGAQPGIWMKAQPVVGETYRQEYYVGEAEDMADVVSLTAAVSVPVGTYENCLQTYDYTPLDPESKEYKYYCKEVAMLVLEEGVETGDRVELEAIRRIE